MSGDLDDILERLANHPGWGARVGIEERMERINAAYAEYVRLEMQDPTYDGPGKLMVMDFRGGVLLTRDFSGAAMQAAETILPKTNGVKTIRYPVKRKRNPEPKPWPGFELR